VLPRRPAVPLLPERWRRASRPPLVGEVVLVVVSYVLYSAVRNGVPTHETAALERAVSLLAFEAALGIDIELSVNRAFAAVQWLIVGVNYYYATLHFVVTIGVLFWLYCRQPTHYRAARTVLYATNAVALLGFYLYPLAPPRLLPGYGYVDTVKVFDTWGSMASGDVASVSNQFAAMPSLHLGWSLWCGVAITMLARRRLVRVLGAAYPATTLVVIVATANHFVLDAVGGAVALAAGFGIQWVFTGRRACTEGPAGAAAPGSDRVADIPHPREEFSSPASRRNQS
jgi:PAP2 superfamily